MWAIDSVEEVATGADARWFKWRLSDEDGHEVFVVVKLARSMISTAIEELPPHTAVAVRSWGRSEVQRILVWTEPPRGIEVRRHADLPIVDARERLPVGA